MHGLGVTSPPWATDDDFRYAWSTVNSVNADPTRRNGNASVNSLSQGEIKTTTHYQHRQDEILNSRTLLLPKISVEEFSIHKSELVSVGNPRFSRKKPSLEANPYEGVLGIKFSVKNFSA